LGNDIVVIVFLEPGAQFTPRLMTTQFNRAHRPIPCCTHRTPSPSPSHATLMISCMCAWGWYHLQIFIAWCRWTTSTRTCLPCASSTLPRYAMPSQ
jgi:hypothetical protein